MSSLIWLLRLLHLLPFANIPPIGLFLYCMIKKYRAKNQFNSIYLNMIPSISLHESLILSSPQVFCDVKVRGLKCSFQKLDPVVTESVLCGFVLVLVFLQRQPEFHLKSLDASWSIQASFTGSQEEEQPRNIRGSLTYITEVWVFSIYAYFF